MQGHRYTACSAVSSCPTRCVGVGVGLRVRSSLATFFDSVTKSSTEETWAGRVYHGTQFKAAVHHGGGGCSYDNGAGGSWSHCIQLETKVAAHIVSCWKEKERNTDTPLAFFLFPFD